MYRGSLYAASLLLLVPPSPAWTSPEPTSAAACEQAQRQGDACEGWSAEELLNLRCKVAERELPAWAAIQADGAPHLLALAMEKRTDVVLRPVTAIAPSLRGLGYPGKPESVKWKSCNLEDQYVGGPVGCFGLVLLFEPTPPPAAAQMSTFESKRVSEIMTLAAAAEKAGQKVEAMNYFELALRMDRANTSWAQANKRYQDRLHEWELFLHDVEKAKKAKVEAAAKAGAPVPPNAAAQPFTLADYNEGLEKIYQDYVTRLGSKAFADLGHPRLAPEPMYASPAQYQAAIQKPGVQARYVVDLRPSGRVAAYTGDLDLFDFHRQPLPASEAELWPKLDAGEAPTQPAASEGDGDWPRRLYLAGVDVYHGPILYWTGWYNPMNKEKTAANEGIFDGVMDGHLPPGELSMRGSPRVGKPSYLVRVTPTCNLCEAWGPTRAELLAWKDGVRAAANSAGTGPRAGMEYRYVCSGRTLFPPGASASEAAPEAPEPAPSPEPEPEPEQQAEEEETVRECTLAGPCGSPDDCCNPAAVCMADPDQIRRCRLPLGTACEPDGSLGACDIRTGGFCSFDRVCTDKAANDTTPEDDSSPKKEALDVLKGKAPGWPK